MPAHHNFLVVTGTGTDVGKTVATAAIAAVAVREGKRVAVLKPAQTGVADDEAGDLAEIRRLVPGITATRELARFREPLAPLTAARLARRPGVTPQAVVRAVHNLAADHDLVLVEGAGGLLVPFCPGGTLADAAAILGAPTVVVARAGLGTLNDTVLTTEALSRRGIPCVGVLIGSWPAYPDLATLSNVDDLPEITGVPLLGAIPAGSAQLDPRTFVEVASTALAGAERLTGPSRLARPESW